MLSHLCSWKLSPAIGCRLGVHFQILELELLQDLYIVSHLLLCLTVRLVEEPKSNIVNPERYQLGLPYILTFWRSSLCATHVSIVCLSWVSCRKKIDKVSTYPAVSAPALLHTPDNKGGVFLPLIAKSWWLSLRLVRRNLENELMSINNGIFLCFEKKHLY